MQYTGNYGLKKPQYGDAADIADINDNADSVDNLIHQNRTMIAPAFDSTKAYVVGDPVVYLGELFVFIADKAAGAWDATKVEPTTAAEMGGGGASALADLDDVDVDSPAEGEVLTYDGEKWVNAEGSTVVTKEATGNPLTFSDGADAPLVECKTTISAKQDLHGYSKPWVGGVGKNKLQTQGQSETVAGITYTVNADGSISYSGLANGSTGYVIANRCPLSSSLGTIVLSGIKDTDNISWSSFRLYDSNDTEIASISVTGAGDKTIDLSSYTTLAYVFLTVKRTANVQCSGTIYPMIRISGTSDTWEPYSNICPISGMDEVNVGVADDPDDPTVENTYTITLGSTRYGGELDAVRGKVTSEKVMIDLGSLTYTYNANSKWFSVAIPDAKFPPTNDYVSDLLSSAYVKSSRNYMQNYQDEDGLMALNTSGNFIVRNLAYTDATAFKTAMTGQTLVYELATPTTDTLSPTSIRSLLGYNTMWTDGDTLEVEYITEGYQALVDLIQSGTGHTYSTSEQVVGKWVDGKDIYEKTVVSELALTSSWQQYFDASGIDTLIDVVMRTSRDGEEASPAFSIYENATWLKRSGYIQVSCNAADWKILSMTIRYTKSTTTRSNATLNTQKGTETLEKTEVEETPVKEETSLKKAETEGDTNE